ncbi:MAG: HAMP domain-containing sensor histidine kinase, partial [Cereibacter changlensis]
RLNAGLEERVQQRTVDLMRANQEVQRFAYIVTHDLRAPLVNIMGFTSELETALKPLQAYVLADGSPISESDIRDARLAAAEDLPEALGFIRSSTRKMDGLINAILKISRDGRRELKPALIDLKALAELTAATVQHQISDMDGSVEIDVRVPEIIGDRLSLEQALGNLVDNAVKYAHPDRPLRLKIHAYREDARMVRIDVSDNGRGISGDDHDRVFELFRRAGAQDRPGEGIGLAHVRTLMRNLGGEITLQSVAGQGSTFTLHVPADLRPVLNEVKL